MALSKSKMTRLVKRKASAMIHYFKCTKFLNPIGNFNEIKH